MSAGYDRLPCGCWVFRRVNSSGDVSLVIDAVSFLCDRLHTQDATLAEPVRWNGKELEWDTADGAA